MSASSRSLPASPLTSKTSRTTLAKTSSSLVKPTRAKKEIAPEPKVVAKVDAAQKPVRHSSSAAKPAPTPARSDAITASLPKAKRSRVPADFADKYSGPRKERKVVAPIPTVEKKARKTAQQREKLRQLMTPDDDIVQRLARAANTTSKMPAHKPRRKAQWESRCGKCGVVATFTTPAAVCAKCGAIAVRVLD